MLVAAELGGWGNAGPDDSLLVCMPVFHVAGTGGGLMHGATIVVMEEFNPAEVARLIPRHRVAGLFLVPAAIAAVMQHPSSRTADFGSVRTLIYGASPIAEVFVEQAHVAFANADLYHFYGLTEAGGGDTILPPEAHDPERGKLRSCVLPYPGFELCIVDANGQPAGEVGEIVPSPTWP